MPSSVIRRFAYDPESRSLALEFTTGKRYRYDGVPPEEVAAMRRAASKGSYFNAHIRDRYAHKRMR